MTSGDHKTKTSHSKYHFSASHLKAGDGSVNAFEFGLIVASHAFQRWMVRCMVAAGGADLTPFDVLVLHHVRHGERAKRLADICLVLHVEDSHTASYSLRKLTQLGLVQSERKGKESFYTTTPQGYELCASYKEVRDDCLVPLVETLGDSRPEDRDAGMSPSRIGELANLLQLLAAVYDQAARKAASM